MVCGETEVTASSLRSFTNELRDKETGTEITSAHKIKGQQKMEIYVKKFPLSPWSTLIANTNTTSQEAMLIKMFTRTDFKISCQVNA